MDCAATVPTTSPGAAIAFMKLRAVGGGRGQGGSGVGRGSSDEPLLALPAVHAAPAAAAERPAPARPATTAPPPRTASRPLR